ncbi:hypothetical protein JB92DRAFT_241028 [Gautieria morchelliformis]|nr:hypothetical protein JB92DRAFT_241028 [Gautieria morchelliformis]
MLPPSPRATTAHAPHWGGAHVCMVWHVWWWRVGWGTCMYAHPRVQARLHGRRRVMHLHGGESARDNLASHLESPTGLACRSKSTCRKTQVKSRFRWFHFWKLANLRVQVQMHVADPQPAVVGCTRLPCVLYGSRELLVRQLSGVAVGHCFLGVLH